MSRRIALLGIAILIAGLTSTANAQSVKTETVSYKSGTETVNSYLALPSGGGKHAAIIVIHEWWGLNDWVKRQAEKYAQQGYVAVAVDLYRGQSARSPD